MNDRQCTARELEGVFSAREGQTDRPRLSVVPAGGDPDCRVDTGRFQRVRTTSSGTSVSPLAAMDAYESQRRASLLGKLCLVVFASYEAKRPMYEKAKALGLRLCALDGPGHWAGSAGDLFERFFEMDLRPGPQRLERALEVVRASGLKFDAVTTFDEGGTVLAAELAAALGLPGHTIDAISTARNKLATRRRCAEVGLPSPRFAQVSSVADLAEAAAHVGFPAVLKPASGVSSLYTYRVDCFSELRRCHALIREDIWQSGSLRALHSDDDPELIWATNADMILEEFLSGEEFDIDCLLSGGRLVYAAVVRDLPPLNMKEVGQQSPPNIPDHAQQELISLAERCLAALGFRDGAFHVEAMYTPMGARLVEINGRIGGGPNRYLHELVWGVDLVEQQLMVQHGLSIRPRKAEKPRAYVLTSDLPAPKSGTLVCARFLEHLAGHPNVLEFHPRVTAGQRVVGPELGAPDWLGEIVVQGSSVADAERVMAEILQTVQVQIADEHSTHLPAYQHARG